MQDLNQLVRYAMALAMGFALGLGAASYFVAPNDELEPSAAASTPLQPHSEAANARACPVQAPIQNASAALAATCMAMAKERDRMDGRGEELSPPLDKVEVSRTDPPSTEPTPESLADVNPMDSPLAAAPLNDQETDNLEREMRQASENTPEPTPSVNEAGLLDHERL